MISKFEIVKTVIIDIFNVIIMALSVGTIFSEKFPMQSIIVIGYLSFITICFSIQHIYDCIDLLSLKVWIFGLPLIISAMGYILVDIDWYTNSNEAEQKIITAFIADIFVFIISNVADILYNRHINKNTGIGSVKINT